ncbi:MAG: tRNA uridine-5-carboxymethylaminomethyl(34) synthesis enzyme MnmG [Chloroflexi bacterium]|nr:tRNA uridine-5-carboxymethylaminomethyl(34) synthesis enzyme MnmG [Chloroflexota bacterium]
MDQSLSDNPYDVIVVGAGHAGCEAALASARMGCRTLLLTMNLDNIALMPCNPSIGGPAKGHLVREIDALGGEMGRATDQTFLQIRMLNTGKGPAVQAPRAQADKKLYGLAMKHTLERQPGLHLKQALVEEIGRYTPAAGAGITLWVKTDLGWTYHCRCLILTTGTSLGGRVIVGDHTREGGRSGEFAACGLSDSLRRIGFDLGRLKTGTPPRIDARTIDFTRTMVQPGSPTPLHFGHYLFAVPTPPFPSPNPVYPVESATAWRPQLPCYLVNTNEETHRIIRSNLHRAPLFTGIIKGIGPRYCPSIEDKINRFPHKESHPLFLEPEGWETAEVYVQGANTSLPEDVQLAMLRTIPALEHVEMTRVGYAIEYDFVFPYQITASLETRQLPGLFLAGQINGTTGYEEAAGQGLMAGINAALKIRGKPPLVLRRDQAYLGVMIDDLVTRDLTEPYRLFTSRAEYRLLLRQDNADLRLTSLSYSVGLVDRGRHQAVLAKQEAIAAEMSRLQKRFINPADVEGRSPAIELAHGVSLASFLSRPGAGYALLKEMGFGDGKLGQEIIDQVEIQAKYDGYLQRQYADVERLRRLEERSIPQCLDYAVLRGLRREAAQKLERFRPDTLARASRIEGVTPADVAILMVHLERARRSQAPR